MFTCTYFESEIISEHYQVYGDSDTSYYLSCPACHHRNRIHY